MSDPALTTKDIADWMGVTPAYVRGEITDGKLPYDDVSNSPKRRDYRIRYSDFIDYLKRRGYRKLPEPSEFTRN